MMNTDFIIVGVLFVVMLAWLIYMLISLSPKVEDDPNFDIESDYLPIEPETLYLYKVSTNDGRISYIYAKDGVDLQNRISKQFDSHDGNLEIVVQKVEKC